MITYITYRPSFPLKQFVDCIWVGHGSRVQINSSHYAAVFTELIFTFDGDFKMTGQYIDTLKTTDAQYVISGLKTEPFQTSHQGNYNHVGLILKPFCYHFLSQYMNTKVMEELTEQIYTTLSLPKNPKFKSIELHLLKLFNPIYLSDDLLRFEHYLAQQLIRKGDLFNFCQSISITQKTFIKRFKQVYMITPSNYVKLKQVNKAIDLMRNNKRAKLTHIGLEAGFYDQSHFIQSFKKLVGSSPKKFIDPHILLNL